MRNLFTVNVKTKEHGFDEFLIRRSDNTLKAQYDENSKLVGGAIKKKFAPLMCLWTVALICGSIFIDIFMDAVKEKDFAQAYSTMGWMLYIGIAGIALSVVFFLAIIIGLRKFMSKPKMQNLFQEQKELTDKLARGLRVPENSAEIDIMFRPYKLKNGKEKYQYKYYENLPMWVFVENDNLCFADTFGVWAVPLSGITTISPFPGHAKLSAWNREGKFNSPEFKKAVRYYKGYYIVKGYYSLQIMHHSEEWEVLIPVYDIDYICELTGKYPAGLI